jgi:hypothetical protein
MMGGFRYCVDLSLTLLQHSRRKQTFLLMTGTGPARGSPSSIQVRSRSGAHLCSTGSSPVAIGFFLSFAFRNVGIELRQFLCIGDDPGMRKKLLPNQLSFAPG